MRFWLLLVYFSSIIAVFGTYQAPDLIEYEGEHYRFGDYGSTPLTVYFVQYPEKEPELLKGSKCHDLRLYRGHVATWKVFNDKLWLIAIDTSFPDRADSEMLTINGNMILFRAPLSLSLIHI